MQREMETLAVFHILKNGGTTLVDRYKHNPGFVYQRIPGEIVYRYGSSEQTAYYIDECNQPTPQVVFGHGVTFAWNQLLQNPVKYATILRDPVKRMMSAYNYFKLEMISVHNHITDIDFTTWIINADRLLPTPVFAQYQQFSSQVPLRTNYGNNIDTALQQQLYYQALENIERLDHVLFIEDNYIEQFDKIAESYGVTPDTSVTHNHNTAFHLRQNGLDYTTSADLDTTETELLLSTVAKDQEFYSYCKGKYQ